MNGARHADSVHLRRTFYWILGTLMWACSDGGLNGVTPGVNEAIVAIAVNPGTATVTLGSSLPLQAVATDASGKVIASPTIIWTVRDTAIASVSSSGVVQGRTLGSTAVAASANGRSGVSLITVQKPVVNRVVVTPPHIDAVPGARTQLTAVALDAGDSPLTDRPVTWSSSNAAVASVDTAGLVTARDVGSATITGTAEGKSGVSTVTVTRAPIASISVTPNPLSMSVGQKTQLTATPVDQLGNVLTGRTIAWSSSDSTIAAVSTTGMLTAVTAGTATVTASSEGKSATTTVSVSNFGVGDVSVQPQTTSIVERASTQLSVIVRDVTGAIVTGRVVTWTSSNLAVATVSTNGLVTGVAPGDVTITATSEGKSGTAAVGVTPAPVASVTVSPAAPSVVLGKTVALVATLSDAVGVALGGRVVSWSSSNAAVATVSSSGLVTGVAIGTADIVAISEGKSGTAKVTVTPPPPAPVAAVIVAPSPASATVGGTVALNATPKDASGNVLLGRTVVWSSATPTIATVSPIGVVTGVAPGTATITAMSEGQAGTATVAVAAPAAASVAITPSLPSVLVGKTTPLTAVVKDASGNVLAGAGVVWSSGTPTIATVSATGIVTGVAAGSATITATSGSAAGTATITVSAAPVASITLSPLAPNILVSGTVALIPTVKDADANVLTGRVVTWSSGTPAVASVSSSGVVTGLAPGTSDITATCEGKSATVTVTVSAVPVASVTVSPPTNSLIVGGTATLTAVTKDASGNVLAGRTITWTSSVPAVATISASGVLTAVSAGTSTITATSEGQAGTATATVAAPSAASVGVTPPSASVVVGRTTPLSAVVKDASGNVLAGASVVWSSGTPAVATVSATGTVTGVAPGTATITATSGSVTGTASITVTPVPVATITLAPSAPSVDVGATVTLVATVKDADGNLLTGRTIAWTSGTPAVATVSAAGVVTGVSPGTSTITATSEGQVGTATVTVATPPPATVAVTPSSASVLVGRTTSLSAVVKDAGGNVIAGAAVVWSSGTPATATVSATGTVTGVAPGTATITATSGSVTGTASITVTPVPVATITLAPSAPSVDVGATVTLVATVKDADGNVLTGRVVTWSSSAPAVGTVSVDGIVTGVAPGTVDITATSEGKTSTVTVSVTAPVSPAVASVTVSPPMAAVSDGKTVTLSAIVKDARGNVLTGRTIHWKTSNPGTATVNSEGVVLGRKVGVATITATVDGKSDSSLVTVLP